MTTVRNLEAVFTVIDRSFAPVTAINKRLESLNKGNKIPISVKDGATAHIKKIQGNVDGLYQACSQPLSITIQNHASAAIAKISMELKALKAQGNLNLGGVMGAGRGMAGGAMAAAGVSAGMVAGAGVAAVAALTIPAAADMEAAMTRVAKTTGSVGEEARGIQADIQNMMMSTGKGLQDISAAYELAGSAGIEGRDNLKGFVEVSTQAADAFKMTSDAAASALSAFATTIKPAELSLTEYLQKAGSAIDFAADKTNAKAQEIMSAMSKAGGSVAWALPTEKLTKDLITISTAIISTGKSGEEAGEFIKDFYRFAKINKDNKIGKELGFRNADAFGKALEADPQAIMDKAIEAYGKMRPSKQGTFSMLFGESGGQILSLSGSETFMANRAKAKAGIDEEFTAGTRLKSSYSMGMNNFWTLLGKIKNTFVVLAQIIGSLFLPVANALLRVLNFIIQPLVKFVGVIVEVFSNKIQELADMIMNSEFGKMLEAFFSGKLPGIQAKELELIKKVLTVLLDVMTGPFLFTVRAILALLDLTVPIFKKIWEVLEWLYNSIIKLSQWLKDGLGITKSEAKKKMNEYADSKGYWWSESEGRWAMSSHNSAAVNDPQLEALQEKYDKAPPGFFEGIPGITDLTDAISSLTEALKNPAQAVQAVSDITDTIFGVSTRRFTDAEGQTWIEQTHEGGKKTYRKDVAGWFDETVSFSDLSEEAQAAFGKPAGSYASGTNYVPKTAPYLLHRGEKVIPASGTGGGDTIINANVYFDKPNISSQIDIGRLGEEMERRATKSVKNALAQRRC